MFQSFANTETNETTQRLLLPVAYEKFLEKVLYSFAGGSRVRRMCYYTLFPRLLALEIVDMCL